LLIIQSGVDEIDDKSDKFKLKIINEEEFSNNSLPRGKVKKYFKIKKIQSESITQRNPKVRKLQSKSEELNSSKIL
jgi:hypothetical protein